MVCWHIATVVVIIMGCEFHLKVNYAWGNGAAIILAGWACTTPTLLWLYSISRRFTWAIWLFGYLGLPCWIIEMEGLYYSRIGDEYPVWSTTIHCKYVKHLVQQDGNGGRLLCDLVGDLHNNGCGLWPLLVSRICSGQGWLTTIMIIVYPIIRSWLSNTIGYQYQQLLLLFHGYAVVLLFKYILATIIWTIVSDPINNYCCSCHRGYYDLLFVFLVVNH